MRPLILAPVLLLAACGGNGLVRGEGAPACASVAAKQRAAENVDKDYEDIRQRTVASPTEKNQRKLAAAAIESAAATASLDAAQAAQTAGRCPQG
ncbi:hypothetical protein [Pseudoxanthomonas sp.]|jgi:hypothetical protein|uniref:hypothetical protein n=1 Tax=Pseudoxanthomonas sp. TaxID=1871049 RepID=UPI002FE0CB2C